LFDEVRRFSGLTCDFWAKSAEKNLRREKRRDGVGEKQRQIPFGVTTRKTKAKAKA
jgi:hypothetical protein